MYRLQDSQLFSYDQHRSHIINSNDQIFKLLILVIFSMQYCIRLFLAVFCSNRFFCYFVVERQQFIVRMLRKHRNSDHQKQMLRNLDILAYEQFSVQALNTPPSFDKATLEMQTTYMRDTYNKQYSLLCDLTQFKKYGPGVYLPFRFLKYLLVVMGILLPLPAINLIVLVLSQDHFRGYNMQTSLQATTIQNLTASNQTLVVLLNFAVLFALTICIFYWWSKQANEILQCTRKTCLSSYYTAILTKIPNCYSEQDMVQFLQKNYGKLHQIYTVKNYQHDLVAYKELKSILETFKTQRQIFLRHGGQKGCLKLIQYFLAYKQKHSQIIEHVVKDRTYEPILAFVTFQTVEARNSLLQDLQVKFNRCGSKTKKQVQLGEQFLYKNQRLQFRSCQLEPNGIKWQNINVPVKQKLIRYSLILCLLLAFLFVSITIFFILAAAQSSLYSDQYDHYSEEQILKLDLSEATKSYCLYLSFSKFKSKSFCQPYFKDYVRYFILYLVFPFFVTFLKGCFALLMKKLVVMRRHKYQFYKIKWEVAIITLFYFIKAGLIKWFIYRNFAIGNIHIKMLDIFLPFLNQLAHIIPIQPQHIPLYQQFNRQWVAHASHKTIMIAIVSFNLSILFFYFTAVLVRKFKHKAAASQPTSQKMKEMLMGQKFDFEFVYAELLALFLFCMLYFSCSPIIYLLVYVSLLLIYWVAKYSLLRLCQVPPIYSHSIHDMAVKIILVGLMMNSLVSPVYYGNADQQHPQSCYSCWLTYWYYSLNFVMIVLFMTCRVHMMRLYCLVKNTITNLFDKGLEQQQQQRRKATINQQPSALKSYSMHSCEKYSKILKILFALNRNEVDQLNCTKEQDIEAIRQIIDQPNNQFKLFNQMYEFIHEYIRKNNQDANCTEDYKQNKEKYERLKEELEKIKQQVEIEIAQQQKLVMLHSIVNSQLVGLNKQALAIDKLQSTLKTSSILANQNINKSGQVEQCMNTDIRMV